MKVFLGFIVVHISFCRVVNGSQKSENNRENNKGKQHFLTKQKVVQLRELHHFL